MNKPRFLLDEHVNRAIQRQLRRLDPRIEVLAPLILRRDDTYLECSGYVQERAYGYLWKSYI